MEHMQFKVSSALKDLVGKDLITNDNVAIFELVKNSYDAYATKVEIRFSDNEIIIADNGKGMSFDDLKNKWLFLGYSAKKDGTEDADNEDKQKSYRDKIKRHYAGAKGIGRFSCDRLGKHLSLTTKSDNSQTVETIIVDWTDFEVDQKKEFAQIDVEHISQEKVTPIFPLDSETGTILKISDLNDEKLPWNRKRLLELKRSLEKLINPLSETNDFVIEIICDNEIDEDKRVRDNNGHERDIVNGILKNSISKILKLKTTQIDVRLDKNYIYTTISDRGVDIYKIRESNTEFTKLENVKINLYFLNRSAKNNFTRLMGIEPVNYGSIFLFRNGFRIMPFGNTGDDSWGLDYRAQQGHSRFLGTRDLFGRVDVLTDNINELKEVSSRDGGLIETQTSKQLFSLFETAHRRLERYVSGVLWGEAFLRKEYFANEAEGLRMRKELLEVDKDEENPNYILSSSIGSKIDFVQLIKTLTKDKNIEILYYNAELANLVSSSNTIDSIKPQFIKDLEKIAEDTQDSNLLASIDAAKHRIAELTRQKEEAERKTAEARQLQREAEEKAIRAEKERRIAEEKAKAEEERRRQAELNRLRAENEKVKAENARLVAEKRAKEEELKRKQAEKEKRLESLKVEFYKKVSNPDTEALIHHVKNNNSRINDEIDELISQVGKGKFENEVSRSILLGLYTIKQLSQKALAATDLILNCDLAKADSQKINLPLFIQGYLAEEVKSSVKCHFSSAIDMFAIYGSKLDLALLIDNFIKNSEDWHAKNIWFNCSRYANALQLDIYDDGDGLLDSFKQDPNQIFAFSISGKSDGTGFGMYLVKETLKTLHASIEVDKQINNAGIHFKVLFK
ncbi:MAG: ATP-binding protein [Bacteroidales bacterium]|nr:ATP-binding protein [Bacteroidales bacterium]